MERINTRYYRARRCSDAPDEPMTISEAEANGLPVPTVRRFGPGTALDHGDAVVYASRWGQGHLRRAVHPRARKVRRRARGG